MISDVLFEALEEIERYQREFDCYEDLREEIEAVKKVMRDFQYSLDTPPVVNENGEWISGAGKWESCPKKN